MIEKYVTDIALQMGMNPPHVSIVYRRPVGSCNANLINICSNWKSTKAIIYYADIVDLEKGAGNVQLEFRIRSALSRLQMKCEFTQNATRCVAHTSFHRSLACK